MLPVSASPPSPADPPDDSAARRPDALPGLQIWLALLSAIAALACVRALLLPPWPHAQPLSAARILLLLRQAGLDARALPATSMPQKEGVGSSSLLAWRLPQAAELRVASVHVRRRDDFQLAWITRDLKRLSLQRRQLDAPLAGMASGRIQGRPVFQTCLVAQGSSPAQPAVTLRALQEAVDRQPRTRADLLRTVVGLSRTRELRCLLVSLHSSTADPPPVAIWQKTLSALALQGFVSVPPPRPEAGG